MPGFLLAGVRPVDHPIPYVIVAVALVYNGTVQWAILYRPSLIANGYLTSACDLLLNVGMMLSLGGGFDSPTSSSPSLSPSPMGIAPDESRQVFKRFHQGGKLLTDKPSGTGLGLAICREIVEHHRGRIWWSRASARAARSPSPCPGVEMSTSCKKSWRPGPDAPGRIRR